MLPLVEQLPSPSDPFQLSALFLQESHFILLDGGMGYDRLGRYSYVTADPFIVLRSKGRQIELIRDGEVSQFEDDPFVCLGRLWQQFNPPVDRAEQLASAKASSGPVPMSRGFSRFPESARWSGAEPISGLPPFQGGVAGYFGYDLCHHIERLPSRAVDDVGVPEMYVGFYDWVLAHDHLVGKTWIVCTGEPEHSLERARRRLDWVKERLALREATLTLTLQREFGRPSHSHAMAEGSGEDPHPNPLPLRRAREQGRLAEGGQTTHSLRLGACPEGEQTAIPPPFGKGEQIAIPSLFGKGEQTAIPSPCGKGEQTAIPSPCGKGGETAIPSPCGKGEGQGEGHLVGRVGNQVPTVRQSTGKKEESGACNHTHPHSPEFRANFTKDGYIQAIRTAKEYIADGEIYEVNLSQRFETELNVHPWHLYCRLREVNPAPFAAYLGFDDITVVSASPEQFLKVDGRAVETRPIKGTRPRGKTPEDDRALAAELLSSVKDRAENVMIVDLLRNDIGRVCRIGSVHVPELFVLEEYPTVHHLVSTVAGELDDRYGSLDLLRACFPGGSVTGCPKIRSMEIIDELEPTQRGVYCGAIGYLGFTGDMNTNIVIRTITVKDGRAYFQVGGAIVADSDPEGEYQETLDKARASILALQTL